MNNLLCISGFRVMVRGKSMTVRPRLNQVPPGRAMLQKLAKRKAVQDVEGTGTERPLGGGWPNASAGRDCQTVRAQPGGELKGRAHFFTAFRRNPLKRFDSKK
jgi:hypothetical protein